MKKRFLAFCVIVALAGCDGSDASDFQGGSRECNPLATAACMLPFPSSVYLTEDATTVTGYRVDVPQAALPTNIDGIQLDTEVISRWDGFSPNGVIVVGFETGVSPQGLPSPDDIATGLGPDASVVIVNMETGERVPLFAEVDLNISRETERALLIRPLARMAPATRYVVAIRKSVKALDGSDLPISPAFQDMLDGRPASHPLLKRVEASYPQIFQVLESAGIAKDDLVLAWDFVTASDEMLTSDLLTMRDKALAVMDDTGSQLDFTVTRMEDNTRPRLARLLAGKYDAPNFLSAGESDPSQLVRGPDGLPELQGMYQYNYAVVIPKCAETTRPLPVMLFGHGLFGSGEGYLEDNLAQEIADDVCMIIVAGDFIGLTERNIATAAFAANDLNRGAPLVEKLAQSVVNFMALSRVIRGPMANDDRFKIGGEVTIDKDRVYYFGASLGGIMGNVFMAYEPNVLRGGLGVPGGNWSMMFERSLAWPPLRTAMQAAYEEPFAYPLNIALMGMFFDPYDPITTAPRVVKDPLPGVPPKQILMYEALHDSLVTNHATEMVARTMDVPVIMPSMKEPWGIRQSSMPEMSGFTIYDEKRMPYPPEGNLAPTDDNGTHADINETLAVRRQLERFFFEGVVVNECRDGNGQPTACDCTTGACD